MTAIASAPAPLPIVAGATHPPPQGTGDRGAFAAVLDSLLGGGTKARPSVIEDKPPSEKPESGKPGSGEPKSHPTPDGAAFGSLPPYSIPLAITAAERLAGTDSLRGRAPASGIEPELPDDAASNRASADLGNFGAPARLVGERTFLSSLSPPRGALAELSVSGEPFKGEARVPVASRGPRTPASACSRTAPAPPPHDPARKSPQPEILASQRNAGNYEPARNSASSKPVEPTNAAPRAAAAPDSLGVARQTAALQGALSFDSTGSVRSGSLSPSQTPSTSAADSASRASAVVSAQPPVRLAVKEIDVDLAPGGLEEVSMTMRLAGDKLSVVIRAASSRTLGAIEGARDAISERLAAIGQPLDSLIVQQAGANKDETTHANAGSAGDRRLGQDAADSDKAGDPGLSGDSAGGQRL